MSERRTVHLGHPAAPRDPLHFGEVSDGGARIHVWASRDRYGITVAGSIQTSGHIDSFIDGEEVRVCGGHTLSIGSGLSCEQAEALIVELQLAIRAKRLADGEPWHDREIAPGVLRAPTTGEAA